jgi:hypothetical protein
MKQLVRLWCVCVRGGGGGVLQCEADDKVHCRRDTVYDDGWGVEGTGGREEGNHDVSWEADGRREVPL